MTLHLSSFDICHETYKCVLHDYQNVRIEQKDNWPSSYIFEAMKVEIVIEFDFSV